MQKTIIIALLGVLLSQTGGAAGARAEFRRTEDFTEFKMGPRVRQAKETQLITEFQVKYGVFHNYLHSYIDRPLFWDRSLRPNKFAYDTKESFAIHAREMKNAGLDGLNLFALKGQVQDRLACFRAWLNETEYKDLKILPTLGYGCDGIRSADLTTFTEALQLAKGDPGYLRINGKLVIPTYNYRMFKQAEHQEILAELEKRVGTNTFSVCGDIDGGVVYRLQQSFARTGKLTDAERADLEKSIVDVLSVADGVQVTVAELKRPYDGEYGCTYDFTFFDQCLVPALEKVYARPAFAKKIIGFYVNQGYVNHISGNINGEEGTGTLRRFLRSVARINPDYLLFFEWNEVNENTMYQPTVRGGRTAARVLKWHAQVMKGLRPVPYSDDDPTVPPLALSYRGLVKPGEALHFELLNIPDGTYAETMKAQVELCRADGSAVTTFPVETIPADRFGAIDYQLDTIGFTGEEMLIPTLVVNGRRYEGFTPIRVDPTVAWNYKAYRHSLRDLIVPTSVEARVTANAKDEYAFSCQAKFPEKLASLELIGNEEELAAMGSEKEFDFASNHIVLAQVSVPLEGRGYGRLDVNVKGAKGCTFIPQYRPNIDSGVPVVTADASGFKVYSYQRSEWVGYYLAIPKTFPADQVTIEFSRPDKKDWKVAAFNLAQVLSDGCQGGILSEENSFRVDLMRVQNLPDLPPHLKMADVAWKGAVTTRLKYPVFHFRAVTENGKVWRSRPFRPTCPTGPKTNLPVYDEYRKAPSVATVPEALIPKLDYVFNRRSGSMLMSGWTPFFDAYAGGGYWYSDPFSDPRIPVKPGCRVPQWVTDEGRDALEFDGVNDAISIPKEAFPNGAFTLTLEVKPTLPTNDVPMVLFRHYDFIRGSLSLYIDRGEVVACWGDRDLRREPKIKTGLKVADGKWNSIEVSYDYHVFRFVVNGARYAFPLEGRPFRFKPSCFGGHDKVEMSPRYPVQPVYFCGRLRRLAIRHAPPPAMTYRAIAIDDAPFQMPVLQECVFPARDFPITAFGAKPGATCTEAIARAMAACERAGGGTVSIPAGTWLTGAVHFRNNCNLQLDAKAVLEFTDDPADYPEVFTTWEGIECYNHSPLLYALGVTNIAITGSGLIAPRMDFWRTWFKRPPEHMNATKELYFWCSTNAPVAARRLLKLDRANMRPHLIQFNRCTNVLLDGFRIRESPFWMIHLYHSANCIVRNLDTFAHGHNNDGVDIDMTRNVLVEKCRFDQGDDGAVLKAGRNADAWRLDCPTENVVIRDCDMVECHALLAIGSELSGGIRNVWMTRCSVEKAPALFRIKTGPRRGGFVENVWVDHCHGKRIVRGFNLITDYCAQWGRFPDFELRRTRIRNIHFTDCDVDLVSKGLELKGDPLLPPQDIFVNNIRFCHVEHQLKNVRDCSSVDISGLTVAPKPDFHFSPKTHVVEGPSAEDFENNGSWLRKINEIEIGDTVVLKFPPSEMRDAFVRDVSSVGANPVVR